MVLPIMSVANQISCLCLHVHFLRFVYFTTLTPNLLSPVLNKYIV